MSLGQAALVWWSAALCVVAVGANRRAARLALLLSIALLALPLFVAASALALVLLAFLQCALLAAAVDFVLASPPAGIARRSAHLASLMVMVDSRRAEPRPPAFDATAAVRVIVVTCAAVPAVILLWRVATPWPPLLRWPAHSACGVIVALAFAEVHTGLVRVVSAALGWRVPAAHDAPHLARSVADFWNRRWNLLVSSRLRGQLFRPLARRRPVAALWAAFAASAAMHAYLLVAVDGRAAWSWGAFFLLQPILIGAERRMRVAQWPDLPARAWTVAAELLLLPLMLWPVLAWASLAM